MEGGRYDAEERPFDRLGIVFDRLEHQQGDRLQTILIIGFAKI
jgi:hypothetical protein